MITIDLDYRVLLSRLGGYRRLAEHLDDCKVMWVRVQKPVPKIMWVRMYRFYDEAVVLFFIVRTVEPSDFYLTEGFATMCRRQDNVGCDQLIRVRRIEEKERKNERKKEMKKRLQDIR